MFRITINPISFLPHITAIKSIFCQENSTNSMKSHIKTSNRIKHKIYINSRSSWLLNSNLNSNSKYCGLPFSINKQKKGPRSLNSQFPEKISKQKIQIFHSSSISGVINNQPTQFNNFRFQKGAKKKEFFFVFLRWFLRLQDCRKHGMERLHQMLQVFESIDIVCFYQGLKLLRDLLRSSFDGLALQLHGVYGGLRIMGQRRF